MNYGSQLEQILKMMDARNEDIRRLARVGGYYEPVWRSQEARSLIKELDDFGRREEQYQSWMNTFGGKIDPAKINLPFEIISSYVLEKDEASLTFDIPSTYKHLMIMGSGRINGSGGQFAVYVRSQFNGDTTATNYQWGHFYHIAGATGTSQDLSDPSVLFSYFAGDGEATSSYAGSVFMFIPHYNSNWYKMMLIVGGIGLTSDSTTAVRHGLWKSTDPIQSITIFPDPTYASAKIVAGSLISVYGIL